MEEIQTSRKLKTILLKNVWVNQEIKELKQFMETSENENTSVKDLWDTAKVVLRGKYIAIQASHKRTEKSKMQSLSHTLNSWRWNRRTGLTHA